MKLQTIILATLLAAPLAASAQIMLSDADLTGAYQSKSYTRITCHDPSIIRDGSKYYIYGSHMGRGYTTTTDSYRNWTNYSSWSDYNTDESSTVAAKSPFALYTGARCNYSIAYNTPVVQTYKDCNGNSQTLKFSAHSWQYTGNKVEGNQWAPDIVYNTTMKKWCMYMSLNGDNWCSSIVLFTSDDIQGPWIYQGPVVISGFGNDFKHVASTYNTNDWEKTDYSIATGETSLADRYKVVAAGGNYGNFWPNCIDPCVFYDENGKLWMSYGSWSGGIFILELDETTGLRDYTVKYPYQESSKDAEPGAPNMACTSDPYFGKKISGGYYVSGEASYIQHIGKYYYLFVTNGQLQATGEDLKGYQMRVFRSENPDGPYVDPNNLDAMPGKKLLNYSASASRDYGIKLFGNYKWDLMPNAEICQGHNSATIDADGHNLLVNHVRFNDGSEGHQVRVHQLFLTKDNWLVASPYEYTDENAVTDAQIASKALYTTSQICGDYQLMLHPYRQDTKNNAYATPVNITLNEDGTITGAYSGKWECPSGTSYINITLNNIWGSSYSPTFSGVLFKQTIDYSNIEALCFSVCGTSGTQIKGNMSNNPGTTLGLCIWGSKADYKAAIKYTLDKMTVPVSDGATINSSLTLPTTGYLGANVEWESSNENVLTSDGTVKGRGDVTLTMKIVKDGYAYEKIYNITVDADAEATVPVYYPESTYKNTTSGWWVNFSKSDYTLAKGKSMQFKFYNYSDKVNNYDNWCLYGASATHGAAGYTEYFGIRCDNWDNTTGSNTGCTSDFDWSTFTSDMNGSLVDITVNYTTAGVFTMTSTIKTTGGKTYNYSYTKTLTAKPANIDLFFVNEKSYIDGTSLATGIDEAIVSANSSIDAEYNVNGQRVNKNYKGVVIRNGKKYMQR